MKQFNLLAGLALAGLASICLVGSAIAQAQNPVPAKDVQSWNDVVFTIPMSKKIDFVIQGTLRFGGNISRPVDERWRIGFAFKIGRYLTFNPYYFHREAKAPHGKQESEDRVTLGATLRFPLGKKFALVDRNLFERRFRVPQVDSSRYRQRLQIEHPFNVNQQKFTFYFADEIFYDWSEHDWVRNRATVGMSHAFNKHFTLELYYLRQNDGRTRPGDIHVIGTNWLFRL